MTNKTIYCHRNKTKDCESKIQTLIQKYRLDDEFLSVYCMKLCFLCPTQYILAMDRSLIVAPNEEEFLLKIENSIVSGEKDDEYA